MENLQFRSIEKIPFAGFEALKRESEADGFTFLKRLEDEWKADINRFSLKGEGLYMVLHKNEIIAIGGINCDPYLKSVEQGRLRRFYVKKTWQRKKIGKALLDFILEKHLHFFDTVGLYTHNPKASEFYVNVGFEKVVGEHKITHRLSDKAKLHFLSKKR